MTSISRILHWLIGCEPPAPVTRPVDDLEPYCTVPALQQRFAAAHIDTGERKAVHKIAARYGAEL
jgi:hypothetical protein